MVSYLLVPHLGRQTPSIDALLGRKDPTVITRPDGLIISGDAGILADLLNEPADPAAIRDQEIQRFLTQVNAQKEEGAAN